MRVEWSRKARGDRQRIWLFLADRSEAYADRVEARIEHGADRLARFPALGRLVPGTMIRRLSIPDVQYVIDYRTEAQRVLILRVHSTRQYEDDA